MKSARSQVVFPESHPGLWDQYTYQAIAIHAGCGFAWWLFSLAIQPTNMLATCCFFASGWLLARQYIALNQRVRLNLCAQLPQCHYSCLLISIAIIFLLVLQASTVNVLPVHGDAIFGWWILSILIAGCELAAFFERRKHLSLHQPSHAMDSLTPNDKIKPPSDTLPDASENGHALASMSVDAVSKPAAPASDLKPKSNWGIKWATVLVVALLFIYMVIVPTIGYVIEQMTPPKTGRVLEDMTFSEKMRLHSVSGIVMLTFLALGATFGSFLNVFIYRVPRGRPLLWPPSSCASCKTRIHGKDNVPVLGWFLINGRCRTCAAPISARYPIIEAIIALVFISLYYVELLSGGENIPVRQPNSYRGIVWILLYTKWDLLGLYLYHCLMLSLLLSVAMMNVDGFRLPWKHIALLLISFGILSIAIPALRPVSSPFVPDTATCIVGASIGGVLGWFMQTVAPVVRLPKVANPSQGEVATAPTDLSVGEQTVAEKTLEQASSCQADDCEEQQSSMVASDQTTRYGEPALAPTCYTDAAFSMAFIGLVLGPYGALSVSVLMLPVLGVYFAIRMVRNLPITLFIFVTAFAHQLFWDRFHSVFTTGTW